MAERVEFAVSADGTRIAFDRLGSGPPLIVLGGIFNTRANTRPLAEALSESFTVINPDRRGRGESTDTAPYAVEREVEDVAALIAAADGRASVYGHSSGAGLALQAAAAGLPVDRLVLHEPPYDGSSSEAIAHARELGLGINAAIAEDRRADAIGLFLGAMGMPEQMVAGAKESPGMLAVAPTMPHDVAVMGDVETGGAIPVELVRSLGMPTLVLAGGASPEFFRTTAERIAELAPAAELEVLDGADHGAPPDVVAPVVAEFLVREARKE